MASEDLEEVIKVPAQWCTVGKVPSILACVHRTRQCGMRECAMVIYLTKNDYLTAKMLGKL